MDAIGTQSVITSIKNVGDKPGFEGIDKWQYELDVLPCHWFAEVKDFTSDFDYKSPELNHDHILVIDDDSAYRFNPCRIRRLSSFELPPNTTRLHRPSNSVLYCIRIDLDEDESICLVFALIAQRDIYYKKISEYNDVDN